MTLRAGGMLMKALLWCCVEKTDGWKRVERWRSRAKTRRMEMNQGQRGRNKCHAKTPTLLSQFKRKCYSLVTQHLFLLFYFTLLYIYFLIRNPESLGALNQILRTVQVFRVVYFWLNAQERKFMYFILFYFTQSGALISQNPRRNNSLVRGLWFCWCVRCEANIHKSL